MDGGGGREASGAAAVGHSRTRTVRESNRHTHTYTHTFPHTSSQTVLFFCLQRFHSITRQVFHRAQAFLLMYDVTSSQSFSAVTYWTSCIQVPCVYSWSLPAPALGPRSQTSENIQKEFICCNSYTPPGGGSTQHFGNASPN